MESHAPLSSLAGPSSTTKGSLLASPPELLRTFDSFDSPVPSARATFASAPMFTPPFPPQFRPVDKMSIAAATNPTPMMLASPPPSPPAPARLPSPQVGLQPYQPENSPVIAYGPLFTGTGTSIPLSTPLFQISEQYEPLVTAPSFKEPKKRSIQPVKPTAEEYNTFVSSAWRLYQSNPRAWLRQERANLALMDARVKRVQKPSAGVHKRTLAPARPTGSGTNSVPKVRVITRPARTPRSTPKVSSYDNYSTPESRMLTPARDSSVAPSRPRTSGSSREDTAFELIPDYSPSIDTLTNPKCLKAEWKGTPLDLSQDPHRDLLHPAELALASVLRLSCASYLASKRRIFQEKVQRAKVGKEFRKTDSQKACKIDVNKASKLWAAYDKFGWFDRRYIENHLN
ncbi:hypothetical protein RUND412_000989 [Rhizina undulata]